MNELKKYISKILHFTENEMEVFVSLFSEKEFEKNEYFATAGEYSNKLGFLTDGVMRAFFCNSDGNEYTKTFFTNFNFVAAYSSMVTNQKNLINIQSITKSKVFVADFKKIVSLYNDYPKIESLGRIFAEQKFTIKEKREIELVTLNATERYQIFRKEHKGLENLIPQYHIASYLGITPTQLSRIRGKASSI
ncbi:cAMP-binding domain of CRP or a regulatory subunit of cAMP-dependent protein kinases [Tenacibaculum sp. MAR_2009_124]|uniref:Crp/Fnr family transcriptional regulator n=1 Tax=Tenacibaculum sp. MAR_2009_124 TaxID=1250059 RepID=UPI000895331F|nr:Crp/Fnr family transcriptional regulator [Tenacibaculum sp. MAR_2009_124]SEB44688.1 cAMP-binding domain of CRP or a regulatory subunit of cAMP-dependent protein kinases [Tenacibaculum sp. MAR_2009_124]